MHHTASNIAAQNAYQQQQAQSQLPSQNQNQSNQNSQNSQNNQNQYQKPSHTQSQTLSQAQSQSQAQAQALRVSPQPSSQQLQQPSQSQSQPQLQSQSQALPPLPPLPEQDKQKRYSRIIQAPHQLHIPDDVPLNPPVRGIASGGNATAITPTGTRNATSPAPFQSQSQLSPSNVTSPDATQQQRPYAYHQYQQGASPTIPQQQRQPPHLPAYYPQQTLNTQPQFQPQQQQQPAKRPLGASVTAGLASSRRPIPPNIPLDRPVLTESNNTAIYTAPPSPAILNSQSSNPPPSKPAKPEKEKSKMKLFSKPKHIVMSRDKDKDKERDENRNLPSPTRGVFPPTSGLSRMVHPADPASQQQHITAQGAGGANAGSFANYTDLHSQSLYNMSNASVNTVVPVQERKFSSDRDRDAIPGLIPTTMSSTLGPTAMVPSLSSSSAAAALGTTSGKEKEFKDKHKHHFLPRPKLKLKDKDDHYNLPLSSASSNSMPMDPNAPQSLYSFAPSSPSAAVGFGKSVAGLDLRHGGRSWREKKKEEKEKEKEKNAAQDAALRDVAMGIGVGEHGSQNSPAAAAAAAGSSIVGSGASHIGHGHGIYGTDANLKDTLSGFGLNNMTPEDAWDYLKAKLLVLFEGEEIRIAIEDLNKLVSIHMQCCMQQPEDQQQPTPFTAQSQQAQQQAQSASQAQQQQQQQPPANPGSIVDDLRDFLQTGFDSLSANLTAAVSNGPPAAGGMAGVAGTATEDRLVPHLTQVWVFVFGTVLPFLQAIFLPLDIEFKGRGSIVPRNEAREIWANKIADLTSASGSATRPGTATSGNGTATKARDRSSVGSSNESSLEYADEIDVRALILITFRDTVILSRYETLLATFSRLSLDSMNANMSVNNPATLGSSSSSLRRPSTSSALDPGFGIGAGGDGTGYAGSRNSSTLAVGGGPPSVGGAGGGGVTAAHHYSDSGLSRTRATSTASSNPELHFPGSYSSSQQSPIQGSMLPYSTLPGIAGASSTTLGSVGSNLTTNTQHPFRRRESGGMSAAGGVVDSIHVITETVARMLQCISVLASVHTDNEPQRKIEELSKALKHNWLGRARTGRDRRGFIGAKGGNAAATGVTGGGGVSGSSSSVRTKPPLPRLDSADSKGGGAYDAGVGGGAVESPDVEGHTHPNPGTTAGSRQSQSRRYSHSSSSRHSLRSNQPVSSSHYHGPATRQPLPHAYSYTYAPYSQHPSTKTGAMTAGGDLEHPPRPRSQSQMQLIPERRELERPRSSGNDGGHGLGLYDVESGRGRASAESKRSESAVGKVGYSQYGHGHFYQHRSRAGFEGGGGSGAPSGRNSVDNGAGDDRV